MAGFLHYSHINLSSFMSFHRITTLYFNYQQAFMGINRQPTPKTHEDTFTKINFSDNPVVRFIRQRASRSAAGKGLRRKLLFQRSDFCGPTGEWMSPVCSSRHSRK
jgi:hypothetical protein